VPLPRQPVKVEREDHPEVPVAARRGAAAKGRREVLGRDGVDKWSSTTDPARAYRLGTATLQVGRVEVNVGEGVCLSERLIGGDDRHVSHYLSGRNHTVCGMPRPDGPRETRKGDGEA
jgi:hypothetical protein